MLARRETCHYEVITMRVHPQNKDGENRERHLHKLRNTEIEPDYVRGFLHVLLLLNLLEDVSEYANESAQNPGDVNEVDDGGKVDERSRNRYLAAKTHFAPTRLG